MIREHTSVLQRIGKALHHQYDDDLDDDLKEPLPQRWIDLILYLDLKEQQQSKAREPEDKSLDGRLSLKRDESPRGSS